MTKDEYPQTLDLISGILQTISLLDLMGFLVAIERSEVLGPILDPTLYRRLLSDPKARLDLACTRELVEAMRRVLRGIVRGDRGPGDRLMGDARRLQMNPRAAASCLAVSTTVWALYT